MWHRPSCATRTSIKRPRNHSGFTLIELMVVVAIVGVLAVLATFAVSKYLAYAKSAEATNVVGRISQNAVMAYEIERGSATLGSGGGGSHRLCDGSEQVPNNVSKVRLRKYQPNPSADYEASSDRNNNKTGWRCLKFEITQPQYYAYLYRRSTGYFEPLAGGSAVVGTPPVIPEGPNAGWSACGSGDLDGDGLTSLICHGGRIDAASKKAITMTQVFVSEPEE